MEEVAEVEKIAAEFLDRGGPSVIADLRERAEIAASMGDQLSAEAWTDIADAAERLLGRR